MRAPDQLGPADRLGHDTAAARAYHRSFAIAPQGTDMTDPTLPDSTPALQLTGSSTMLAGIQRAAEAYMRTRPARIAVNGGVGTARGYKALLDGTTDVAMASGAAPFDLAAAAAARGLAFGATVVARDVILPLLHPANPVAVLTLAELGAIFSGRIVNWRELGGDDAAIEVLAGPPSGGVTGSWRSHVIGDGAGFTPRAVVRGADERMARVASCRSAITYLPQMALPPQRFKVPRIVSGAGRTAPLAAPAFAPLMLVTLGAAGPAAARFIAYAAARHDVTGDARE